MSQWFYFGCHQQAGHYVFTEGMRSYHPPYGSSMRNLNRFDGMLPPQDNTAPYIATVSRLEGWGLTALAFWDYSVDKRGGCNSVVFAPSMTIEPADLLAEAQRRFPQVFSRLPKPVTLAASPEVPARKPLAQVNRYCSAGMCLATDREHEADCPRAASPEQKP